MGISRQNSLESTPGSDDPYQRAWRQHSSNNLPDFEGCQDETVSSDAGLWQTLPAKMSKSLKKGWCPWTCTCSLDGPVTGLSLDRLSRGAFLIAKEPALPGVFDFRQE